MLENFRRVVAPAATWVFPCAVVLLAPRSALAAGEGLALVLDLGAAVAVVTAVSVGLGFAASKAGSRGLLAASVVVGALPAAAGPLCLIEFVGSASVAGLALSLPFLLMTAGLVWVWLAALGHIKKQRTSDAEADAWIAQRKEERRSKPAP
jgi:hypothetical protein